jgi:magnesium-protoporphyrin IX monomethyl ester (oxidative) cyclase
MSTNCQSLNDISLDIRRSPHLRERVRKVLLINPPGKITVTAEGSRERKLAVPPLGLAYLAAKLVQYGIEVEILDVLLEGYENEQVINDEVTIYGLSGDDIRKRISEYSPDLIGVSCLFSNRAREVLNLCNLVKDQVPDVHLVLGGQHPSGMPSMILDGDIDYILYGEADNSLVKLIAAINDNSNLAEVTQIVLRHENSFWKSPLNDIPDPKNMPWPAWDKVNLKKYWEIGLGDYEIHEGGNKFIVMLASRGCPHACAFCTAPFMTERRYRVREDEELIAEIKYYVEEMGVEEIHFWDDNFFINKKRIKEVLKLLADNFPNTCFQVPSGSEINRIDDEVIDLLARANFKKVFLNVESGDEEIQKLYVDKHVKLERVPEIVSKLRARGIITEGVHMAGFPGETKEQIDKTFKAATSNGFDRISVSIVNPLPGTELWEQCEKENLFHDDFDIYNIRWSNENIKLKNVERGYISKKRTSTWEGYMKNKIDITKYQDQNSKTVSFDAYKKEDD